jgi:predicted acetyltransferase
MTTNFELRKASWSDRVVVDRMLEFYLYDYSEFDGFDLDEHGCYRFDDIDFYWLEPAREVLVVQVDGKWAGFALISDNVLGEGSERTINDFFIMRKYRRTGLGRRVAQAVFERTPSNWEVCVHQANIPAAAFWREVIADYTGGRFGEVQLDNDTWQGPLFTFDNRQPASQP